MMKKLVFFLVSIFMIMTTTVVGQTVQQRKQIRDLNLAISREKNEIAKLEGELVPDYSGKIAKIKKEIDSLEAVFDASSSKEEIEKITQQIEGRNKTVLFLERKPDAGGNKFWHAQIEAKNKKIADLEQERDNIFLRYTTTTEVPTEISPRETRRRNRANYLRREELTLEKIEGNLTIIQPTGQNAGYKVIIANDYIIPITFAIYPIKGGDKISVNLAPNKNTEIYLIPGTYSVSCLNGGNQIGNSFTISIDGSKHIFQGKECFAFAYMPRW